MAKKSNSGTNTKAKKQESKKAEKSSEDPKQNIITKKAGLLWNVHTVRKNTSDYFETHDKKTSYTHTDPETDKEVTTEKIPQFSGAQVAITAGMQCLASEILKLAFKRTVLDNSGLKTITRGMMSDAVSLNYSMNKYYSWTLQSFNKDQTYAGQVPVSEKEMTLLINSIHNKIQVTPKARNLLCFLLAEAYAEMVNTTFQFMIFAGKKSLKGDTVTAAIENRFPSTLAQTMISEVNRAMTASGNDIAIARDNEDGDGNDESEGEGDTDNGDDSEDDSDTDEEAAPAKGKKAAPKKAAPKKVAPKKGKKAASKIDDESDDDAENNSSDDDDNDDGDGSDDENVTVETKKGSKADKKSRNTRRST